jgi:acetyl-CoA carboxylase biotin carboxyl carrier protein
VSSTGDGPPVEDPVVGRVRALLDLAARYHLAEMTVEAGDFKLCLRASVSGDEPAAAARSPEPVAPTSVPTEAVEDDSLVITAPMIGTFYLAPAPGEPPFVTPGDRIEIGQTVGIIEAMKIMNEIQADQAGELIEIVAQNGRGVEFGQPLFRLQP